MNGSGKRLAFVIVGMGCLLVAFLSVGNPAFCQSGCGSMTEPIFSLLYWAFGAWGTRAFMVIAAAFFFWGAATWRE